MICEISEHLPEAQFKKLSQDDLIKAISFSIELTLVLLRCVGLKNAHLTNYGEIESKWEAVHTLFCAALEIAQKFEQQLISQPNAQTLTECFTLLIRDRRFKKHVKHCCIWYF